MTKESEKLHIKELKKYFSNYNIITIDDFNEFYNNVFGSISRKTVGWYIYDLKKRDIIKNISRGQYVLTHTSKSITKDYVVITMDIIDSSNYEITKFNSEIERKVNDANLLIKECLNYDRKFSIFQGDEIQIICPFDDRLKYLFIAILCCLRPFEVRYGISIGENINKFNENSWAMNGPIFWNARDQLDKIKKSKEYSGLIISEYSNADKYCNNIIPLINKAIGKITDKQWEAIRYEVCGINVNKAIEKMNIGVTSYYDRISVSNYHEIIQSLGAIFNIMKVRKYFN